MHWIQGRLRHKASAVCCCIDLYVLAHFRPSPPVSVCTLSHNFCTVLAWMCPQASLVNVPFHTTLICALVFFCNKPPQPGNSLTFLSCLSPHQAKWVLINSSWLLPSACLLHWFTSLFLFFSCSSRFQVAAPALCTHLHRSYSINPGRSLLSPNHPLLILSCHPFVTLSFYLSYTRFIALSFFPFLSPSLPFTISLMPFSPIL